MLKTLGRQRSLLLCSLVILGSAAAAQNLITFSDGQVAQADQINNNFQLLEEKIEALNASIFFDPNTEASIAVDCTQNPNALQQTINRYATLNALPGIVASGSCGPLEIINQNIRIGPTPNAPPLTITNAGTNNRAAITVSNGGSLTLIGVPIEAPNSVGISLTAGSTLIGGYVNIGVSSSTGIGIDASAGSHLFILGQMTIASTITAIHLKSSTGTLFSPNQLVENTGVNFYCDGPKPATTPGEPACLNINPAAQSTSVSLVDSAFYLNEQETAINVAGGEAELTAGSTLALRAGHFNFPFNFVANNNSNLLVANTGEEILTLTGNLEFNSGSHGDFDFDEPQSGSLILNGDMAANLGASAQLQGDASRRSTGAPNIIVDGSVTSLGGSLTAYGASISRASSVIGGKLILGYDTFNEFANAGDDNKYVSAALNGSVYVIDREGEAADLPSASAISNAVTCDNTSGVYWLPLTVGASTSMTDLNCVSVP